MSYHNKSKKNLQNAKKTSGIKNTKGASGLGIQASPSTPYIGKCYDRPSYEACATTSSDILLQTMLDQYQDNIQMIYGVNGATSPGQIINSSAAGYTQAGFSAFQTFVLQAQRMTFINQQWWNYVAASTAPIAGGYIPQGLPHDNGCPAFDGVMNGWDTTRDNWIQQQAQTPGNVPLNTGTMGNTQIFSSAIAGSNLHYQWWLLDAKIKWAIAMQDCCDCNEFGTTGGMPIIGFHHMPDGTLMADKDHDHMLTTGGNPVTPPLPMVHKWVKCDKKLQAGISSASPLVGAELEIQLEDETPVVNLPYPAQQYQGYIHGLNTFYNWVGQPSIGDVVRVQGHRFHGFRKVSAHSSPTNPYMFNYWENHANDDSFANTTDCYIYKGLDTMLPYPVPIPGVGYSSNTQGSFMYQFGYNVQAFQSNQFINCSECWNYDPTNDPTPLAKVINPFGKTIKSFDLDFNDIKAAGETRGFSILGDNGAKFSLEVTNEDGYYYNFQTNLFQTAKTKLSNAIATDQYYSGRIIFPVVTDADQYDFTLTTEKGSEHSDYKQVKFSDESIDINSSTGSNSNILKKVIYQTLDTTITLSNYSGGGLITSIELVNQTIAASRGKTVVKTPFEIKVSVAAGALTIDRQPLVSDVMAFVTRDMGDAPDKIPGENEYPTATPAFTGDDINGAITSGAVVRMDNTDLSQVIRVGDKITTLVMTDTVNGDFSSGATAITMDAAVATKMAVGDQVTGNPELDAGVFTVASIDSTNVFSLDYSCSIDDGITLSFSSRINRSETTVTVVETSSTATDFTMSQAIQFRDNAPLTFFNRRNYRWAIDNMDKLVDGMSVKVDAATNGFADTATIKEYLDEITIFEGETSEQKLLNERVPGLDTLSVKPTLTRNGTTKVKTAVQTGSVTFSEQALFTMVSASQKFFGYGDGEIERLTGYNLLFSDLKAELNAVTTTTTAAVSASTTIPVTSKVGIVDKTTQTVDGATLASKDVVLDSITGLGIGQSLYVGSGLVGTPTITAINETTKKITLSTVQTFADGITLTFPNSIISGPGIDSGVIDPYVNTISSLNLTSSVAQTLEDAQTFTFTGAGDIVTITGNIIVNNVGNEDVTLRFDIDRFLTQH